jgi:hypothetical protein
MSLLTETSDCPQFTSLRLVEAVIAVVTGSCPDL